MSRNKTSLPSTCPNRLCFRRQIVFSMSLSIFSSTDAFVALSFQLIFNILHFFIAPSHSLEVCVSLKVKVTLKVSCFLTGPISLCVDLFVFICAFCVFFCFTAYVLYCREHGGLDLMGLKPNP